MYFAKDRCIDVAHSASLALLVGQWGKRFFEGHGAMQVRYYVTEIVDGQLKRTQRSERLCAKDNKHHSKTSAGPALEGRFRYSDLKTAINCLS